MNKIIKLGYLQKMHNKAKIKVELLHILINKFKEEQTFCYIKAARPQKKSIT